MLDIILLNLPILLCVLIGMGLLIVEMFLPGFGLPGISGVLLLGVSLYLTWSSAGALAASGLFVVIVAVSAIALTLILRSTSRGVLASSKLVLHEQSSPPAELDDFSALIGKSGETLTPLRPAGMADISGERVNVVSEGDFISKGQRVVIDRIEGSRVIVKAN